MRRAMQASSFNEAGAVMPRKGAAPGEVIGVGQRASMRPGLLCPGKVWKVLTRVRRSECFNEAGAVMPRKGSAPVGSRPSCLALQ